MIVNNDELLAKIEEWNSEMYDKDENKNKDKEKHIHFALLEIFIEFEKFLTNSFIAYALGGKGKNNFAPTLRVQFEDEEHLLGFIKCNNQYIDYIKKIQEIKEFIFVENTCPFNKIFSTAEFTTYFKETQTLRNFIAHQSQESKDKYQKEVLRPKGINSYILVKTFLQRINKRKSISHYSIYVNAIKFYSEIICDASSE